VFIFTAKLQRKKILLGAVGAVALCAAAASLFSMFPSFTAASSTLPNPKKIRTAEDRVAYLEEYGWLINPTPLAVEELLIPQEFDSSYDDYLALQSSQGFDLTKYQGKKVKRYTYEILNYPTGETGVQAGILMYRNTIIGGEVLSPQLNGFIHGLSMPEKNITPQNPTA
jgi:hypothetical protein